MSSNHLNPNHKANLKQKDDVTFDRYLDQLIVDMISFVEKCLDTCFTFRHSSRHEIINSLVINKIISSDELVERLPEPILKLIIDCEDYIINDFFTKQSTINNGIETILLKAEAAIDWSWEQMNIGKYCDVKVETRKIFAYQQLLKSILILISLRSSANISFEKLLESLHCLDRGLMVCQFLTKGDKLLTDIATMLHNALKRFVYQTEPCKQSITYFELKKELTFYHYKQMVTTQIPFLKKPDSYSIPKVSNIDFIEFQQEYLRRRTPVIITDAIKQWPCLSNHKWTLDYLLDKCAFRLVPIEIGNKYTDENWSQKLMTIADFVRNYIITNPGKEEKAKGYLAQHNLFEQINELESDFTIPDYCATSINDDDDNSSNDLNVEINAWFGPGGTVSPLHTDPKDNIFVQVMGCKYVRLYSDRTPKEQIYPHDESLLQNTSKVDIENVDYELFNNFTSIDDKLIHECVLNEGEMLYIPKMYWHFVKSLSTSFSLSFWWS